ncbi:hypothetical protein K2Y11_08505 [bacterium]|nr:hypothetical protein [bacterium]
MASKFQVIVDTLRHVLPRRGANEHDELDSPAVPVNEFETKIVDQAVQTEKRRWRQIIELGVPTGMLVVGGLLTGCAQLLGVWGLLGFLLLSLSPVVYWQQRTERQLKEMTEELKKLRPIRR